MCLMRQCGAPASFNYAHHPNLVACSIASSPTSPACLNTSHPPSALLSSPPARQRPYSSPGCPTSSPAPICNSSPRLLGTVPTCLRDRQGLSTAVQVRSYLAFPIASQRSHWVGHPTGYPLQRYTHE